MLDNGKTPRLMERCKHSNASLCSSTIKIGVVEEDGTSFCKTDSSRVVFFDISSSLL